MQNPKTDTTTFSVRLFALLLAIAVLLAYSNSLHGPFIYDDTGSIPDNPSIRSLSKSILQTYYGRETVSGRPVLNFSFAINYALHGLKLEGYHLTNILIHLFSTLFLFGFIRRLLQLPSFEERIRRDSLPLASAIAALWGLHPLQTESVTYIVQRAESLMGFFYILTLYTSLRSHELSTPLRWQLLSILFCYCGMGTKEVMGSAPLVVILVDWIYIENNFHALWQRRRNFYFSIASSWILMAYLNFAAKTRLETMGFSGKFTVLEYLQTQCWAYVHYLHLIFWPKTLIFDFGIESFTSPSQYLPGLFVITVIGLGILYLLTRSPRLGFLGLLTALLMAPSSSFIPIHTETVVEHRLYLALAPFFTLIILAFHRQFGRKIFIPIVLIALTLGIRTYLRNQDYQSIESIWKKTVTDAPWNPRAHNNYAGALYSRGQVAEAEFHLQESLRLEPDHYFAYMNYADLLQKRGDFTKATEITRRALALVPNDPPAKVLLANLLLLQGKIDEATPLYRELIQTTPSNPIPYLNLGSILESQEKWSDAEAIYLEAIQNDLHDATILDHLHQVEQKIISP